MMVILRFSFKLWHMNPRDNRWHTSSRAYHIHTNIDMCIYMHTHIHMYVEIYHHRYFIHFIHLVGDDVREEYIVVCHNRVIIEGPIRPKQYQMVSRKKRKEGFRTKIIVNVYI